MRKAIIAAAVIAVLLIIAGVVLPWFIGWDEHARTLATNIKETTGYEVSHGKASGSMLPWPELELHDISVGNSEKPVVKARLAKAKFSWGSVFSGSAMPDEVVLLLPELHLADKNVVAGLAKTPVDIIMQQAGIFYGDSTKPDLEQASFNIYKKQAGGAVEISWPAGGSNVKISASWAGWPYDAPADVSADFDDGTSKCTFSGRANADENKNLAGSGKISCQTTGWGTSLNRVAPSWQDYGVDAMSPQAGSAAADFEWSGDNISVKNLMLTAGEDKIKGDMVIGGTQSAISLDAESIVLDPYLESADKLIAALKARKLKAIENTPEKKLGIVDERVVPLDLTLNLNAKAAKLQWRGQWINGLAMEAVLDGGVWTVAKAEATLPAEGNFSLNGVVGEYNQKSIFNGKLTAEGKNMKQVLDWLKTPLPKMPDGTLGNFKINSSFALAPEFWRLTETNLQFDDVTARGAMVVKFPPPKKLEGDLALPDLRPEQIREQERKKIEKAKKEGKQPIQPAESALPVQPEPVVVDSPVEVELSLAATNLDIDKYLPPESFMPNAADEVGHMSKRLDWLKNLGGKAQIAVALSASRFRGIDISEFHGNASLEAGKFEMPIFRVTLPEKEISGAFVLTPGSGVPGLDLTLYTGEMKAEEIMSFIYARPYSTPEKTIAQTEYKWPEDPIDLSILNMLNGALDLNMDALTLEGTTYSSLHVKGRLQDSVFDASHVAARLSQGEIALRGKITGGSLPQLEGSFVLGGVDFDRFLGIMLDVKSVTGKTRISGSIKTSGISQRTMVSNLNGNGTVDIDDLSIKGFDLNSISRRSLAARTVDDVAALGKMSLEEGNSRVKRLEAHFAFKDGLLQLPVTSLETEYTSGGLQMTVDILRFLMNMKLSFKPRTVTDGTVPPLHLIVQGAVETPQKKLDIADLEAYIAKRAVGQ